MCCGSTTRRLIPYSSTTTPRRVTRLNEVLGRTPEQHAMKWFTKLLRRPNRSRPHWLRARLRIELLESRDTPSGAASVFLDETEPNDTLDHSQSLGDLSVQYRVELSGAIGNGSTGPADVDWYSFTLDQVTSVTLTAISSGGVNPILSVYNSDPYDFGDPFTPVHYRQLGQTAEGTDSVTFALGAGTYYAAVSGNGNRYFHPFLAGSGSPGEEGAYTLTVAATELPQNPTDGPVVLGADPGSGAALGSSPFAIRVAFDTPLDPGTIGPDQTVRVIYNPTGAFGDGTDTPVALASYNLSTSGQELQLFPAAALRPGYYEVVLAGDTGSSPAVLTNLSGVPIGTDDAHPTGQDYTFAFQITGVEGQPSSTPTDDTPPFARDLGELAPDQLVQLTGAIGDDPYYDPTNPDTPLNPSADVDMYHFRISGPGRFGFTAEVFAGRIGSPLDPGLSLFKIDPGTGQLVFVAGNNDTRNDSLATNGTLPLNADPALFEGLTAGDYYMAVSANYNTPTSVAGGQPGTNGIFDPNVTHSGSVGFSTGPYVLTLGVHPDSVAPTVVVATLGAGTTLGAPPTTLVVGFSEAMNLQQLVFSAFEQTSQETISAVYLEAADGTKYFPRLQSYDATTNEATFLMLDGVPNGDYALHLSGALGLTDFAGNPLTGNDPSGDYVVRFTVAGPIRGANGDPLVWTVQEPADPTDPQVMGAMFPHEFQSGITITRAADPTATDTADAFRFEVLQNQSIGLILTGGALPASTHLELVDESGTRVEYNATDGDRALETRRLNPGTYVLSASGWTADEASGVAYEIRLTLLGSSDNPPPLTIGSAPAVQLRIAGTAPSSDASVGNRLTGPPLGPSAGAKAPTTSSPNTPPTANAPTAPPEGGTPGAPESLPVAPGSGGGTSTVDNRIVTLPGGLLAPLAGQPLGGVAGADQLSGPGKSNRVTFQVREVTPEFVASVITFIEAYGTYVEPGPGPAEIPSAVVPSNSQQPAVAAPAPVGPLSVEFSNVRTASPAPSPETRPADPNSADNESLAVTLVAGDTLPTPDADGPPEVGSFGTWGWLASLSAVAAPLIVLWRRTRRSVRPPRTVPIEV